MTDDRAQRAQSFGAVAELYERYRPGYPDALADLLLADGPTTAVEIGAGTGKATRLVAGRGVSVTAVEPDPGMRAVLQRRTADLPVTVVGRTLETLPPQTPVDLLFSASAWHWTTPETRWELAARQLRPGGTFASFGSPASLVDEDLVAAVDRLRLPLTGPDVEHVGDADGMMWPGNELRESPYFTDVRQDHLPITYLSSADDYVGLLSTISSYLMLPLEIRADLLVRIHDLLPENVEMRQDVWLHRATRTTP